MILDARELEAGQELSADVCVVGGGPAGISVARSLAARGRSVLLLEAGGHRQEEASQALYDGQYRGTFVRTAWPEYLSWSRVRALGGSTGHWEGWCRPLDPHDFEERPWVPHSGWPIEAARLKPWYAEAATLLGITPFPEHGGPRIAGPGFFGDDADLRDAWFYFSPPVRFGSAFRTELKASPRITTVLYATARAFAVTEAGAAIDHVPFAAVGRGLCRARAKAYVLACGGVENARVLLLSDGVQAGGLGNAHDVVGRYFMDHPHLDCGMALATRRLEAFGAYRRLRSEALGHFASPVWALTPQTLRRQRISGGSFELRPRSRAPRSADAIRALTHLGGPDEGLRSATLHARFEQIPNPASRVTLIAERDAIGQRKARLDWQLTDADKASVARSLRVIARALGRLGLGRLHARVFEEGRWPRAAGGCHHMGTTRMHRDPRLGVVDPHCRVHGVANLYVAGSSVFPTGGYANPTLTLVALALRLGDHLHRGLG